VSTLREGNLRSVADTGPPRSIDFEEFYAAYFQSLTIQLFAYTSDMAAAQDVVQEAFCRALARWQKVAAFDDPAAWVRRVAWNLATSRWRRARTAAQFAQRHREEHIAAPSPDRVALARALGALPAQQRRAVILYYLADLSVSQIASQEGVASGTVKSWLHRGRAALAAQLTEKENDRG
jgi:RNA polymerase sigma-70 factor (ECF subfamily)